jgi:Protein of unknown function (DUF4019)
MMTARLTHTVLIVVLVGFTAVGAALAQRLPAADPAPSNSPRVTNITADSAPGWLPSSSQTEQVLKTTASYLSTLDAGQYERAYGMMAEIDRRSAPLPQYIRQNQDFYRRSGPLKRRDILKITWTKDPAAAPFPGVYAAIDVVSYFANVDRHCGFIVLYQKPAGGDFEVMREESNFIDNATAENIERQQSRAALDAMWAKLATNCPNYRPAAKL